MNGSSRALPWVPWGLTLGLVAFSWVLPQENRIEFGGGARPQLLAVLLSAQALTFATVGVVISRARPGHSIGRLFAVVGVVVGFYLAAERYQHLALVVMPSLPFGTLAAWVQAWAYVLALAIVVSVLPQLFPTGHPVSPGWKWALALPAVAFVAVAVTDALRPGIIEPTIVENPIGISEQLHAVLSNVSSTLYIAAAVVGFASLVARWRRANHRERQQLKLFAYAAALLPLFIVVSTITNIALESTSVAGVVSFVVASAALLGLPIATAASILRYRLYDIDLVINRTLVYAILSTLLVAAYLVGVLVFRLVLDPLTGESDLAVAASTLAVAALFRPLRGRVQGVVDRRFYRSRYDAARTLEGFSDRLRHEVDLRALGGDLQDVVHDTMQPEHVSLWLRSQS